MSLLTFRKALIKSGSQEGTRRCVGDFYACICNGLHRQFNFERAAGAEYEYLLGVFDA
jgi:hypothetical protein